jgi:predicted secreted hydrolase
VSPAFGADVPIPTPDDPTSGFLQATHPRDWTFPRDHGRHDGFKTEWWYFTGNLSDPSGRKFGYQITFFRTSPAPLPASRPSGWALRNLYFAHAAVSDIDAQKFLFKDRLSREHAGLAFAAEQTLNVGLLDWTAALENKTAHLHAAEDAFAIDLDGAMEQPPVMQGPGGVNAKGRKPEQASYYYSMPRLQTSGTLTVGGKKFTVHGLSWMDHEFSSNALSADQVGWDWMALTLADGSDVMIYRIRNRAGAADYLSGTLIKPDRSVHYLAAADIALKPSRPWKSPISGGAYPQQWEVEVAGLPKMLVRSRMPGQELVTSASTKVDYFEGSVEIVDSGGRPIGEGYLEMTGYGQSLGGF